MKKLTVLCVILALCLAWMSVASCGGETKIKVSGNAFSFALPGNPYGRIVGAEISILEHPEYVTKSVDDGYFEFIDLPAGMEATFVLKADGFPPARTKTFTLPETDLAKVSFQIPNQQLFDILAVYVGITPDKEKCQMVSTVTRVGKSVYDEGAHGEAGALVSSSPAIPAESGPIYFNSGVMPDRTVTESSDDGGVLYTNVAPGEYTLTASKQGVSFESIKMKCEAGVFVNASPPYGLQALQAQP
jgi:hypothetical protein